MSVKNLISKLHNFVITRYVVKCLERNSAPNFHLDYLKILANRPAPPAILLALRVVQNTDRQKGMQTFEQTTDRQKDGQKFKQKTDRKCSNKQTDRQKEGQTEFANFDID